MANLQGYKKGAVGNMLNHFTRHQGDPEQERYRYKNQNIDASRTHLNYALFARDDPKAFVASKVEELDTKPTKTTNVISTWIVTLPQNDALKGREREFFECAYDFLEEKVSEENIVGAYVHMDETTPHMHFCFVPICESAVLVNDKARPLRWTEKDEAKNPEHKAGEVKRDKRGTVRYERVPALDESGAPLTKRSLSQSSMFDRKAMQDFHPALSAFMEKRFGFNVGIELEDEGDKVLSKLDHRQYKAAKRTLAKTSADLSRLEDRRQEIRERTALESERLEHLQQAREGAGERVACLETIASECRAADAAPIREKGALFARIAALCHAIAQKLGLLIKEGINAATQRLSISIRNSGAHQGVARSEAFRSRAHAVPNPRISQRQIEAGMSL